MTAEDIELERIVEQETKRAKMKSYLSKTFCAFDIIVLLSKSEANAAVFAEAVPSIASLVLPLLRSPLTCTATKRFLRPVLERSVSRQVVVRLDMLTDALLIVAKDWQQRDTNSKARVCETVLDSIAG